MNIALHEVAFPTELPPTAAPQILAAEHISRIQSLYRISGVDWVIVYGDREHNANLLFLSGYDPRFEEALLLIGPAQQYFMVVGNEGQSYVPLTTPWIRPLLCQSLSLLGQPRDTAPQLSRVLAEAGVCIGTRVGVVGWKYLETIEEQEPVSPAYVPAYMVEALRKLVGQTGQVIDVTTFMMHPAVGLRAQNSAAQIAVFEYAAMRASAHVFRMLNGSRPGMREYDAVANMRYEGDPLSAHVMYATGKDTIVGLRSPTARRIELGDGVTTAVSYWGSLVCRAGMMMDVSDTEFFQTYAAPYFRVMATWYQSLKIGVAGGDIYREVTDAFGDAPFNSALNPGHLVSYDEWVHTPIRPGSQEPLASGMALQSDIIPAPLPAGLSLNCEDTLVLADTILREEIASTYPEMWRRMQHRRNFMRDGLGILLADEVLPLSTAPAYLPPFWLLKNQVCVVT